MVGYYGPDKMSETRGFPTIAEPPPQSIDVVAAGRLWDVFERLMGVPFSPVNAEKSQAV